jgi:hypothetical protein
MIFKLTLAKTSRRKVLGFILDLYLRISALGLSFLILFVEPVPCEDFVPLDCVSSSEVEDQPCSRPLEGPLLVGLLLLAAALLATSSRLAAKILLNGTAALETGLEGLDEALRSRVSASSVSLATEMRTGMVEAAELQQGCKFVNAES